MMFHDVSQCFTSVSCFTMFNNVSRCLVSRATIGRDRDNAAGIGDNSSEIGDDAEGSSILRESDPMLNSILNGDWSNSVPGRQFPKGPVAL